MDTDVRISGKVITIVFHIFQKLSRDMEVIKKVQIRILGMKITSILDEKHIEYN